MPGELPGRRYNTKYPLLYKTRKKDNRCSDSRKKIPGGQIPVAGFTHPVTAPVVFFCCLNTEACSVAGCNSYPGATLSDIKDIVPLITFLVTDGWWITGQTIFANGGYTTR